MPDARYWFTLEFRGGKHGESEPWDDGKTHMVKTCVDWPGMPHDVWSFFEAQMTTAMAAKLAELGMAGMEAKGGDTKAK